MHRDDAGEAARIVAEEWQQILAYDADLVAPAMVRAAYAEPRLRQLFPMVSHGVLFLSRCTKFPAAHVPAVYRKVEGGYTVIAHGVGSIGEVDTLAEAFALVVANLPEGCGPAVIGTADDVPT
ncbi:DUF6193 family natural product biosynthesis protein [Streptomyces pristinaespiralis]|uniref:DUF6193 family natural product biosynthesis protein n=1 Tax=Streptomyces pristinaespiralis TaxID=38300 RepID=UPI0033F3A748